jgi:tetratricopeptide (TPR) repeat protein
LTKKLKSKMKKSILAGTMALAMMLCSGAAFSQCKEVVWPDNPEMKAKAEESKVLYEDAIKSGDAKAAVGPFNWMLKNVPNHHVSLYINGVEIYDKLASTEKDAARKKALVDTLLLLYDMRIKTCGEEPTVTNRKALSFVKHSANEKPAEALAILDKAFQLNGNNVMDGTIVPYMQVIRLNKLKLKTLTDEQILERYDKLVGVIDAKVQKAQSEGKPIEKYQKMKNDIDEILVTIVTMDCNFVKKNLEPKYRQNTKDLTLAKKIFTFMLQGKCTDDPLWLEVAEQIHTQDTTKNCGLAKNLGIIYISKDNYEKAETFLKEAQKICAENNDKGEIMMYLGAIEAKRGNRGAAREMYRQAASTDPALQKQVFEKIGDLYMGSFESCAKKQSKVEDRLVYLLAYDYYQKAGEGKKAAAAKEGFPSKEEIFTENVAAGSSMSLKGCWSSESTTIRTRD